MKILRSAIAPIVALALTGAVATAGSIQVKDAAGVTQSLLTFTFNGIQAYGFALIDTTGAQIDPATKQGQTAMVAALTAPVLPTGAATAAKQPALGTAGAPSTDVLGVQGVNGGTPMNVVSFAPQLTGAAGLVTTVGTTPVTLFNANTGRHYIQVQVQSAAADCYINGIGSASSSDGSSLGIPRSTNSASPIGGLLETSSHIGTGAISIVCTGANTTVFSRQG